MKVVAKPNTGSGVHSIKRETFDIFIGLNYDRSNESTEKWIFIQLFQQIFFQTHICGSADLTLARSKPNANSADKSAIFRGSCSRLPKMARAEKSLTTLNRWWRNAKHLWAFEASRKVWPWWTSRKVIHRISWSYKCTYNRGIQYKHARNEEFTNLKNRKSKKPKIKKSQFPNFQI